MRLISAEDRNKNVYDLLKSLYKQSLKHSGKFPKPFSEENIEMLFCTHIWGHREITLTILVARLLDRNFKASENFYACNPRSIFEKPIRKFLREMSIPHKKSGPLNVAKNIQKINTDWALNKRGEKIAFDVVDIVLKIESVSETILKDFAVAYLKRYCHEADKVKALEFEFKSNEDPLHLFKLCKDLINDVPDGGSIPQIIIGLLMESYNEERKCSISMSGHRDSVSCTNTTSKKAGDIIESFNNNSEIVYEITVKEFTEDRLRESYESVKAYDSAGCIKEVFVICRKKDIPTNLVKKTDSVFYGEVCYQDIVYYFIDIFEWILLKLLSLTPNGRNSFYAKLIEYVNEPNASEKVKRYFKLWHESVDR